MLVPIAWLKDYTDVQVGTDEYVSKMVMSGSNLEEVDYTGRGIEGVVVGEVVECSKHPEADRLSVCMVDVGKESPIQIVCGAPNVRAGIKVPVALDGSHVPGPLHGQPKVEGGVTIHKGALRGVESNGMICSCGELGFDDKVVRIAHRDGIWILPDDAKVGEPVEKELDIYQDIIDFEITPNRPDCLSMLGMARETAATFETGFTYPDVAVEEKGEENASDYIDVEIKATDACKRYVARVVKDVRIEQSPWWMQKRLMLAGMRPINNIVDITNFVMLELGHPIHAFDIRQIEGGKIIVEKAAPGETFVTLDEQERKLDESMLLIKDAKKGVALAGVMGGLNSEIEADTTTILIEAANFDPDNIRLTSKALGLRTEASARYEKGVDPNLARYANDRVCRLIELLGAGTVLKGAVDCYPVPKAPWSVEVRPERMNKLLGTSFTTEEMIHMLERLEIGVEEKEGRLICTPPTVRLDLETEVDFSEEIARMYGYDRLPVTLPKGNNESSLGRPETLRRMARTALAAMGADEIQTYSFVSPKDADKIGLAEDSVLRDVVPLINPLGEDTSVMRTMMLPEMLETLGRNYSRGNAEVKFYEIGNTFRKISEDLNVLPMEADAMTLGMYGGDADFFALKGMITEMLVNMGITGVTFVKQEENKTFHPGRCADVFIPRTTGEGEDPIYIGTMGEIYPDIADAYGIGTRVYAAELFFALIGEQASIDIHYEPLPKYPSTERDIALVVDEKVTVGEVEELILANGGEILESVKLFDIFRGVQVGPGKKSLAFNLVYRSKEGTLTDEEVAPVHDKVVEVLEKTLNANLRAM